MRETLPYCKNMTSLRTQMRYLNPYDVHKLLINDYLLKKTGDTAYLRRDTSKDRNDYHVLVENHKFLWEEDDPADTWEQQFAKRYYNKLFKEYCIGDLSRYKENKIALRWRIEKEVITGKGQFICGNKKCNEENDLHTWEVNFGYVENAEKKNALVKIRLCVECSKKLNFHSKKKEIKRLKKRSVKFDEKHPKADCSTSEIHEQHTGMVEKVTFQESEEMIKNIDESPWEQHKPVEQKSRDEEMEEYLQDLLL